MNAISWKYCYACNPPGTPNVLRLVCLCLVGLARRAIFVIENPEGSLIYKHVRFEYLTNIVAYDLRLIKIEL